MITGSRRISDVVAALVGLTFFSLTVGLEKLNPRNIGWLTFEDQQLHLLGWWFYASDQWRWPLGANPNWGWDGTNSIVYTDSWPGMALVFKSLDIAAINHGQYFGLGFLIGYLALFVGAQRLFRALGMALLPSLVSTGLLGTTSVFWWMQRWYPALTAGLPLLVWAIYLYVDDPRQKSPLWRRWSLLFVTAAATHAYLTLTIIPILGALLVRRLMHDRNSLLQSLTSLITVGSITATSMYVFGYFTLPSKWAQTGGYGWYSANVLGLLDFKEVSHFLPNLPSLPGQHEPTALGQGTVLLLIVLIIYRLRSRVPLGILNDVRKHAPLTIALLGLSALAVTNTVSIGSWSFHMPVPMRIEHGLSIFRSSARLIWPLVIAMSAWIIVMITRTLKHSTLYLFIALCFQLIDSGPELVALAQAPRSQSLDIVYDQNFWQRVPNRYTLIVSHPAQNAGVGWSECSLAAVRTGRAAQCGFFGRVQGLDVVNTNQDHTLLSAELDPKTIYWVSVSWLKAYKDQLLPVYQLAGDSVMSVRDEAALDQNAVIIFGGCSDNQLCSFLPASAISLRAFLLGL